MDGQHNYPTIDQFVAIEKKTAAIMADAKLRVLISKISNLSLGKSLSELIIAKRPDTLKSDNYTINLNSLEEIVYVSANTCKKILNGTTKSIKLETLLCFCAGLKLEPVLSRYLIAKAGLSITIETDINNVYNTLIDDFYEYGIDAWNYALDAAGMTMLGQSNVDEIQNRLSDFRKEKENALKSAKW